MSKKNLVFTKALTSLATPLLVASHLIVSLPTPSFASAAAPQTAEVVLLSNAIAIAGEGKSQDEIQQQLAGITQEYMQNAPAEDREDRIQDALVQLNVMTAKQAQTFRSTVDAGAQQDSDTLIDQSVQTALASLPGAQFSSECATKMTLGAVAGIASTVFVVRGNTTVSKPVAGLIIASLFLLGEAGEVYECEHGRG